MERRLLIWWAFMLVFIVKLGFAQTDTAQIVISNRINAEEQLTKPYVILISVDGFRYDYMEKYGAEHLVQFAEKGVKADALIPSFPSITFPNHYTLVTGLYPAHHGLLGNTIYDPAKKSLYKMNNPKTVRDASWYGGIPIWTLAEQQHLLSASFYWPGSEAPIGGLLPSYYYPYNEKIPINKRINTVVEWLSLPEEKRPHLITFYFPEVDHAGHLFGPEAPETAKAVQFVDSAIYALNQAVLQTGLAVNFILVSDHGMKAIDREHPIDLSPMLDTSKVTIAPNGTLLNVHVKEKAAIRPLYKKLKKEAQHYRVFLKKKVPSKYHYRQKDDVYNRVGDIVLLAKAPFYFSSGKKKPNPGAHGYEPNETPEMRATFIAWGPNFKKGHRIPAFENVHLYPLLARILGLSYTHQIDGKPKVLENVVN